MVCYSFHNVSTQSPIPSPGTSSGMHTQSCVGVNISVGPMAGLGTMCVHKLLMHALNWCSHYTKAKLLLI